MEELGEQCFTVVSWRPVAVRVRRESAGQFGWVGLMLDEGVADDAGEVTAVKVLTGEVGDGPGNRGDGQAVDDRPFVGPDGGLVDSDVGSAGLFAYGCGEFGDIGVEVPEIMD